MTPNALATLREHDVVKCLFRLGDMTTADAVEELAGLKLMTDPAVFARTNQLLITDTVAKLKAVHAILEGSRPGTLDNGNAVRTFTLKHADADDILTVVRPHLGLATGESIGIDVSVTSDLTGKNIFVSGLAEKITLIESLINDLDRPMDSLSTTDGTAELRSHRVAGGNVDTVYNVLVTMLAGKQVRLSMDASTSSIVALGGPAIHEEIAQTVSQLQASDTVFEVIQLNNIDPYFAISLLEEMLELSEPTSSYSGYSSNRWRDDRGRDDRWRDDRWRDDRRRDDRRRDDRRGNDRNRRYETSTSFNTAAAPPPKIDADPATRRLFVRATSEQILQIKTIIAQIDVLPGNAGNGTTRLLSILGAAGIEQLETAAKFWRDGNPIILYASATTTETVKERIINGDAAEAATPSQKSPKPAPARYLTNDLRSQEPPIRCQVTPRGMLLQCDDPQALDRLEQLMQTLAGTTDSTPSPPVVFYLKYTKPVDALRMLGELLDGGVTAQEAETGSLVNGTVSTGFYLGSIVTSQDGTATLSAGTITIVADSRLNRLIAQGT
ncbi:MAG: general secretion pathway protein, partial [Pirellulales bacterium]|nr:general secretion pathway protein [Pirellulales bacterium]